MLDKFQERYGYRLIVLEKIRYENHIIRVPTQRRYWEPETWIWWADFWAILMDLRHG